jgi:hypothetical protein
MGTMKLSYILFTVLFGLLGLMSFVPEKSLDMRSCESPFWGFFVHKRINRLAVFTLPPEMMVFFKPNIGYISENAVAPDVRRYAVANEASHHYIDLDRYGSQSTTLPRTFSEALSENTNVWAINEKGDSILLFGNELFEKDTVDIGRKYPEIFLRWKKSPQKSWKNSTLRISQKNYRQYFRSQIFPKYEDGSGEINADSLRIFLKNEGHEIAFKKAVFKEELSEHGILPWHLQKMQRNLTYAFKNKETKKILKLCADFGHYIGDAHVPLHTTSNYNGQKTDQEGLHAFWESRIPELFADEQYDYIVGKPEYFDDKVAYFWNIVMESNRLTDSVFILEKALRAQFPEDQQLCPDTRNEKIVITQCHDFSEAYQTALNGMVERRMRGAIHAVSSAWFTAWVDAGQPDLSKMEVPFESEEDKKEAENLKKMLEQGKILGRPEDH